jgi:deoxyribonuclease-2
MYHLLLLCLLLPPPTAGCLDADGNEVDWFFQYKMPNGYKVTYTDSNSKKSSTLQVVGSLDDKENPPALIMTLRSLANKGANKSSDDTIAWEPYFMYNDQPDNASPSSSSGHTKGVVSTGSRPFWLLHSTPNFPSSDGKATFYFPEAEIIFGQTFLCVAISSSAIEDMATQLSYTHPYVYVNKVGDASGFPKLAQILDGSGFVTSPGATSVKKFGSFTHVAKNANWDDDMYENLVATTLKSDLVVESWIRGSAEGTYCKPKHDYEVVDVENMMAVDTDGTNITWKETQDHAKWALTRDSGHPYVCIADINRMTSQRSRGGGAFCFQNANLAGQLSNSIVKQHACRGSSTKGKHNHHLRGEQHFHNTTLY